MARIELVRSGGFAGLRLRSAVDTATEPDPTWYDDQLAGLDLGALASPSGGLATSRSLPQPDRFHYALSVDSGDGNGGHRLEFAEADMPIALAPLVARLETRAHSAQSPPAPAGAASEATVTEHVDMGSTESVETSASEHVLEDPASERTADTVEGSVAVAEAGSSVDTAHIAADEAQPPGESRVERLRDVVETSD